MKRFFLVVLLLCKYGTAYCQETSFIQHTEAYLKELSKDEYFSLSIAIAKDDKVVFNGAYGYANREHKIPNKIDTRYNIASTGKMFTAVAILQLYDEHKIDLNEKVGKYIPDFPNKGICDSVTIHQLLAHTSGLPLWFNRDFASGPKFAYLELKDYLPLYNSVSIDRDKVGKHSYSNVGFFLMGYIIEAVSGMSYKEYLDKHIFQPLNMRQTGLWWLTEIIPNSATGYMRPANKRDWWKTNFHKNMSSSPAGGAYSSVGDLLKFLTALRNNKLLSQETTALMLSPKVKTPYGNYGYGIMISEENKHPVIGHLGEFFGIRGEVLWYKDEHYTISVLSNDDQTDYNDIDHFIKTALTGTKEEQRAYANTQKLLRQINAGKFIVNEDNCKQLSQQKYDEGLIQIKAYYHLNNNELVKAIALFKLNTLLFPADTDAKDELAMAEKRQAE